MEKHDRLFSLDALRGFDMLFLMGLAGVITEIAVLTTGNHDCWLAQQMHHVKWDGFRQRDTIFPLFLFIAGVAWPFSFAAQLAKGRAMGAIRLRILKRAAILFLLGMVYNGILALDAAHFRVCSVLGLIGIAWAGSALLYTVCGIYGRVAAVLAILAGYSAILLFVPSPLRPGTSPLSQDGCFAGYLNGILIPGKQGTDGNYEPQALLCSISAIATAALGTFAGDFVRCKRIAGNRKAGLLFASGCVLALAAWALDGILPVNKKLWSPTFVFAAGGYSLVLFAFFYWICDVRGWRNWAFPFKVVGLNPITIYLMMRIVPSKPIVNFFLGGVLSYLPAGAWHNLVLSAATLVSWWLVLLFLYRKNVFLKV